MILLSISEDPLVGTTISKFAERTGFRHSITLRAHDKMRAIDRIIRAQISVVLIDLDTITLRGASDPLWNKVFANREHTHVILIGIGDSRSLPACWSARFDGILQKPFRANDFEKAVVDGFATRAMKRREILYLKQNASKPASELAKMAITTVESIDRLEQMLKTRGTEIGAVLIDSGFLNNKIPSQIVRAIRGEMGKWIRFICITQTQSEAWKWHSHFTWFENSPQNFAQWKLLHLRILSDLNDRIRGELAYQKMKRAILGKDARKFLEIYKALTKRRPFDERINTLFLQRVLTKLSNKSMALERMVPVAIEELHRVNPTQPIQYLVGIRRAQTDDERQKWISSATRFCPAHQEIRTAVSECITNTKNISEANDSHNGRLKKAA